MEVIAIWLMVAAVVSELWCVRENTRAVRELYKTYDERAFDNAKNRQELAAMHKEQHSKIMEELGYKLDHARIERDAAKKRLNE